MTRHEFRTVSSTPVYRGNIFALRADEVSMPGGRTAKREVVEHYGAAVVVAIDDDENVVLIHQYRHPVGRRLWELPAGLLDVRGEPPLATAQRELAEEVGLGARDWSVLVDVAASPGMTDEVARVFLARGLSTVDRPDPEDEEADIEMRRVPLEDAVRMVMAGEIINGSAVSGLLAAQAVLAGRQTSRPADSEFADRPHTFGKL